MPQTIYSAWSNVAGATTPADAPQLGAIANHDSVSVSWTPPPSPWEWTEVQRSLDGSSWSIRSQPNAPASLLVDTSVSAGTTYHYRVRWALYDEQADEDVFSDWSNATTGKPTGSVSYNQFTVGGQPQQPGGCAHLNVQYVAGGGANTFRRLKVPGHTHWRVLRVQGGEDSTLMSGTVDGSGYFTGLPDSDDVGETGVVIVIQSTSQAGVWPDPHTPDPVMNVYRGSYTDPATNLPDPCA